MHADVPAHCSKRRQRCAVALRDKRALPHVLCAVWCTLYACLAAAGKALPRSALRMSPQQPNVLQCSGGAARWHSRLLSERTLYSKLRLKRQMNHSTAYRYAERLQCISIGSTLAFRSNCTLIDIDITGQSVNARAAMLHKAAAMQRATQARTNASPAEFCRLLSRPTIARPTDLCRSKHMLTHNPAGSRALWR